MCVCAVHWLDELLLPVRDAQSSHVQVEFGEDVVRRRALIGEASDHLLRLRAVDAN